LGANERVNVSATSQNVGRSPATQKSFRISLGVDWINLNDNRINLKEDWLGLQVDFASLRFDRPNLCTD
jgi:hypothetical protein